MINEKLKDSEVLDYLSKLLLLCSCKAHSCLFLFCTKDIENSLQYYEISRVSRMLYLPS
jgi:hypothetical protein